MKVLTNGAKQQNDFAANSTQSCEEGRSQLRIIKRYEWGSRTREQRGEPRGLGEGGMPT